MLLLGPGPGIARADPFSNAGPADQNALDGVLEHLKDAADARDPNALQFYGASVPADASPVSVQVETTAEAVSQSGALVHQDFTVTINRDIPVVLSKGSHDLWLSRMPDGSFALTPNRFVTPTDALASLEAGASAEMQSIAGDDTPAVLDLVASRVGGRWIALRRQRWDGKLEDDPTNGGPAPSLDSFLQDQMQSAPADRAVTAHFILQRMGSTWVGIGTAFVDVKRVNRESDVEAASFRERMQGTEYMSAGAHKDYADALTKVGLWGEAADEYQKAELLQPGLVGQARLQQAQADRASDPQNVIAQELQTEQAVGLGPEHPTYMINALEREQENQPSALGALRLALEYSRLADETRAATWEAAAESMVAKGVDPQDAAWINLLYAHLQERKRLAAIKPPNILRSALFTVRVFPGDPGVIRLLAALEEAQHTVYADFGIPMGNTEVLLWRNQDEFAKYTTQFSAQGGSEFVAALTLTKLVSTKDGPLVLGEEINLFTEDRESDSIFGTLAHEYGHVAVRQLARGRMVPVWFNEGIATSVEGGYEGYIDRVRRAANAGGLLSVKEMEDWNVDGERAFLAYSQANSILDYIVSKWGKNAVLDILRQIGKDTPPDDAFKNVLGLNQSELYDQWVQEGIR